jgi:hypothetical protein
VRTPIVPGEAHARDGPPQRLGPARVALDRDDLPGSAHQRAQMRRLATRSGTEVEHTLARPGRQRARHAHGGARLRHD